MKPFDLEAAKRGEPLVTRDGRKAVFIAHVPEFDKAHRVVCRIERIASPVTYYEDGRALHREPNGSDLFMAPKKQTVYLNVYGNSGLFAQRNNSAAVFQTKADAQINADNNAAGIVVRAVPIEIEV
ncbi:hypothetical protein [Paraburkholderia kururiensis]|uniref:hypothetical protein n=1 Tax=Paraburkholderia kururiensis TaxID=984307 RepID=UPI0005A8496A|nr:hypothetical protein [Paraburkholderia kururiensis]